jgi:hypothetical protein
MALSSLLGGSLAGIVGSLISNVADIWKRRQERKHELALKEMDIRMMDKEYQYKERRAEMEGQVQLQGSADDMREGSYEHDSRAYSADLDIKSAWLKAMLVIADFVRALIRPALTVFLIWLVWETRQEVNAVIEAAGVEAISVDKAVGIYGAVVEMILFLASTAVTWWFGTRPMKRRKEV